MKNEDLSEAIFMAIGGVTALFMSNPQPGTEQVMPDRECTRIGYDLVMKISKMIRASREPFLGYATTGQLLEELSARIEMHATGGLNYRTVDGESCDVPPQVQTDAQA